MFKICLQLVFYFLSVWCWQNEKQMALQTKTIITKQLRLGEGPHWDEETQSLYLVDIHDGSIVKYDPKTGSHKKAKVSDAPVSVVIPVKNQPHKFLITSGLSVATVFWDGVSETVSDFKILETLNESSDMRINDGKVSPSGVLFAGTMPQKLDSNNPDTRRGNLYSFKNMKAKKLLDGISVSNGLAWTSDEKTMYYIDSVKRKVLAYDYDKETTEMTNPKTVLDFEQKNLQGFPDGMTIDTSGNLWVACYNGSKVVNVNPHSGEILKAITFPAAFTTSVAFGGPNFEDLYVTSANGEESGPSYQPKAEDGCTFVAMGTGARGLPATKIQL